MGVRENENIDIGRIILSGGGEVDNSLVDIGFSMGPTRGKSSWR